MIARENPFAMWRLERLEPRLDGVSWNELFVRFHQLGGRSALVGPHGAGKTTLAEAFAGRWRRLGGDVQSFRLSEDQRQLPHAAFPATPETSPPNTSAHPGLLVVLDGAEQLSWWGWRRFLAQLPGHARLLITTHGPGRLPTLHTCRTTPALLANLVAELIADRAPEGRWPASVAPAPEQLFAQHHGNLRDALRDLYDRFANLQPTSGPPHAWTTPAPTPACSPMLTPPQTAMFTRCAPTDAAPTDPTAATPSPSGRPTGFARLRLRCRLPFPPLPLLLILATLSPATLRADVNQVTTVATNVWFHEGDVGRKGHCNNGWVEFADYLLVVDGNFPSGAQEILPKIRAQSSKPIRFVFDTHHHGDHAYGNEIFRREGAVAVAHAGVLAEMKRFETGYYGGRPGRWEDIAKNRKDVAASRLHPPTLTFERELAFDDGGMRVELRHFGTAHTRGDGFAWLPRERILFTGDACVNGPYNSMGDADTTTWVRTLEAARALQPRVICPGHGPMGGPEILDHQIEYLRSLQAEVRALIDAGLTAKEVKAAAAMIKQTLRRRAPLEIYIGPFFDSQVEKIHADLTASPR